MTNAKNAATRSGIQLASGHQKNRTSSAKRNISMSGSSTPFDGDVLRAEARVRHASLRDELGHVGSLRNRHVEALVVDVECPVVPLRRELDDGRETPFEVARPQPDQVQLRRVALVDLAREPVRELRSQTGAECLDRRRTLITHGRFLSCAGQSTAVASNRTRSCGAGSCVTPSRVVAKRSSAFPKRSVRRPKCLTYSSTSVV
jgi:hypothetical protein